MNTIINNIMSRMSSGQRAAFEERKEVTAQFPNRQGEVYMTRSFNSMKELHMYCIDSFCPTDPYIREHYAHWSFCYGYGYNSVTVYVA